MTDTNTDDVTADDLSAVRVHSWSNTLAVGVALVALISMLPGETTVLQLVTMGAGLLLVLGAAFSIVAELSGDADEPDDAGEEAGT